MSRYDILTTQAANRSMGRSKGARFDVTLGALSVVFGLLFTLSLVVYFYIDDHYTYQTGFFVYPFQDFGALLFLAFFFIAPLPLGLRALRIGLEKKKMAILSMGRSDDGSVLGFSVRNERGLTKLLQAMLVGQDRPYLAGHKDRLTEKDLALLFAEGGRRKLIGWSGLILSFVALTACVSIQHILWVLVPFVIILTVSSSIYVVQSANISWLVKRIKDIYGPVDEQGEMQLDSRIALVGLNQWLSHLGIAVFLCFIGMFLFFVTTLGGAVFGIGLGYTYLAYESRMRFNQAMLFRDLNRPTSIYAAPPSDRYVPQRPLARPVPPTPHVSSEPLARPYPSRSAPDPDAPGPKALQDHVEAIYGAKDEGFTFGYLAKYQMGDIIGEGGFSRVYRVQCNGSAMVMKLPKSVDLRNNNTMILTQVDVDSYRNEAIIWAKLTKELPDAVINLIDAGVEPFPWLVMELADGNLRTRYPNIAMNARLRILTDLLYKLQSIHELNVVHRDIKPDNVLVVDGNWKLTDFGLSKIVNNSSRSTHLMSGTYQYMAPEQMDTKKWGEIDIRTDIWQFGAMAVEVLSGHLPFDGDSPHIILSKIMMVDPELDKDIPENIRVVLQKALKKEKAERWQSAQEFANALSRAAAASGLAFN